MLKRTLTTGKVVDAMIHDARTIAICRQHGVKTLWSDGRDLARLAGVQIANPLMADTRLARRSTHLSWRTYSHGRD